MNTNIRDQVLAAINFGDLSAIVTTAGLALIGIAFLSFVLRQAQSAANGRIGDSRDDDEDDRD